MYYWGQTDKEGIAGFRSQYKSHALFSVPKESIVYVLVKVEQLVLSADFVKLDMEDAPIFY